MSEAKIHKPSSNITLKQLWDMELHDQVEIKTPLDIWVTRVSGGFIYNMGCIDSRPVFVPLDNEKLVIKGAG